VEQEDAVRADATRYVDVFSPAQASCRECRARWQRAVQRERSEAAASAGTGLSAGSRDKQLAAIERIGRSCRAAAAEIMTATVGYGGTLPEGGGRAALEAEVAEIMRHQIMTTDLGADGLASAARVAASAAAPAITGAILLHGGTLPDDGAATGWAGLKEAIAAVVVARILADVPRVRAAG
jgi:hypothetical protein